MPRMRANVQPVPAPGRDFLPGTAAVRSADWRIAPVPAELQDCGLEMTGPLRPATFADASRLLSSMVKNDGFAEFLTLPAYELLP